MNNNLGILYAFLGGAIVGAGAALLLLPKRVPTCQQAHR